MLFFCLLLPGWSLASPNGSTSRTQFWTRVTSVSYSEPLTVYSTFHELEGDLERGDEAFTHNQVEFGVQKGRFSLALIARYDYDLKIHPDTFELMHASENDISVDIDRKYTINGSFNHARSAGIKLGLQFQPISNFDLEFSISLLRANLLLYGDISGDLFTHGSGTFSGEANIDYSYTEDLLLHRRVNKPEGYGYAFDVQAHWRPVEHVRISASVKDWAHRIYWKDAPFTTATVTSATVNFDENGFLETTPLLSGVEGNHDLHQRLPGRTDVTIGLALSPVFELEVGAFNVDSLTLPRIGVRLFPGATREWFLNYGTKSKAITFGTTHKRFSMQIGMDQLDYKDSNYISIGLSYIHPL